MSTKPSERQFAQIARQVTDSISNKRAHPDNSPVHSSTVVQYTSSGALGATASLDEMTNYISTLIDLSKTKTKGPFSAPESGSTHRLSDVAIKTGFSAQYINNLIVRYQLITPLKSRETNGREAYEFSEKEIVTINRLKYLLVQGRPFREAVDFLKQDEEYQKNAIQLVRSLQEWSSVLSAVTWHTVVEKIAAFPIFTEPEKHVLLCIDGERMTLAQSTVELQLTREDDVRALLDSAYAKLGRILMYVLRLLMKEAI